MAITSPARIASAVTSAVAAASSHSADFADGVAELDALDRSQVTLVLAGIIRQLLEIRYPDGLDAADAQDVLTDTARASAWCGDWQPETLAEVLMGALGLLEPEQSQGARSFSRHATLLISALLRDQPITLAALVKTELAEIERAETMELP